MRPAGPDDVPEDRSMPPLSFSATGDLSCCDGLEPVTVWPASGSPPSAVDGALRRQSGVSEAEPSDGFYTAADVTWHLPAEQLASDPTVGGVVSDAAGVRYVVLSVERAALGACWRCRTRNLAIVNSLDSLVSLQQATWTKTTSGVQVPVWADVRSNLAARIQPQQTEIEIEYDRRLTRVTHKIFLADEIAIDHTYQIVAGTETYRVLGCERQQRIDALFVILASQTSASPT
jgi:hypothetical protein